MPQSASPGATTAKNGTGRPRLFADFLVFVVENALFAGILWGSVIISLSNGSEHADQTADRKVARLGGCLAQ